MMKLYVIMFWKTIKDKDGRMVIFEATQEMPKLLGPFQEERYAREWLEDNHFKEGPGFYVYTEGDRPGDIEEGIWWNMKKKKIAAEIREMEEPIRL